MKQNNILIYKNYYARIEFSIEDECLVGHVLYIDGVISFSGDSYSEMVNNFHQVIDEYLADCDKRGISPVKTFKGSFNVRISKELHKQAAHMASRQGLTLNQFVARAIECAVNEKNADVSQHLACSKNSPAFSM